MAVDETITCDVGAASVSERALKGNTLVTRRAHHPLDEDSKRRMVRLMQLHHETHPARIARAFGVTARYVRILWTAIPRESMASLDESLAVICKRDPR